MTLRSAEAALAYYTDCAIATYSESLLTKKYSKADRRRYRLIAQGMVQSVNDFFPQNHRLPALKQRLEDALRNDPENKS